MLENTVGYYCYYLAKFVDTEKSQKNSWLVWPIHWPKIEILHRFAASHKLITHKMSLTVLPLIISTNSYKHNTKWQ